MRIVHIPNGVGCCCFIHRIGMREPDNRIKLIQFPHLFCLLLTGGNRRHKKNDMKTTHSGTYLDTFISNFKFWAHKYNIAYFSPGFEPLSSDMLKNYKDSFGYLQVFNDVTLTAYVSVQNNRLGYGDFIMLSRDNGRDLLAVKIVDASDSLISIISSLMVFNGVPVKTIVADRISHLVIFDY